MATKQVKATPKRAVRDHRIDVAEKKRVLMRARLVDAAMRAFADQDNLTPVIDDVIREAKVSRGTFYNYFNSLDEVLVLIGQDLTNQMTTEILPVYGILVEPWQRFSVGYRLFLTRAMLERKWAGFVTRTSAWAQDSLVARHMCEDLSNGKKQGQFVFDDVQVAADFLKGAAAFGIQALHGGVANPIDYIDSSVRMGLASLGCDRKLIEEGVKFSSDYMKSWLRGDLGPGRPQWALNMNSKDVQKFLSAPTHTPELASDVEPPLLPPRLAEIE